MGKDMGFEMSLVMLWVMGDEKEAGRTKQQKK
jgi:hypothetical protein